MFYLTDTVSSFMRVYERPVSNLNQQQLRS